MSGLGRRIDYVRRIVPAYVLRHESQLTFWHDEPSLNPDMDPTSLGPYYMSFARKADYQGPTDQQGIPMLQYHGAIGLQYNPIAISQWGLGNYDAWKSEGNEERRRRFMAAADWLVSTAETTSKGVTVWMHQFDFEYRTGLRAPWYSGLAQGQAISLLVRAARETGEPAYLDTASAALDSLLIDIPGGGVGHRDEAGDWWIEEYLVDPPSHILNGFIWACWGPLDYWLATGDERAHDLFRASAQTIARNLHRYDTGYWSTYEIPWKPMPMLASPFYHRLHIAQLAIMARLTGERTFSEFADTWEGYRRSVAKRSFALGHKAVFKLRYY